MNCFFYFIFLDISPKINGTNPNIIAVANCVKFKDVVVNIGCKNGVYTTTNSNKTAPATE